MIAFDFLSKHFELDSFYKLKIYRLYSYVCNLESQAQKRGKEKEKINKDIYAWKYDMYQEQLLRWFLLSV